MKAFIAIGIGVVSLSHLILMKIWTRILEQFYFYNVGEIKSYKIDSPYFQIKFLENSDVNSTSLTQLLGPVKFN